MKKNKLVMMDAFREKLAELDKDVYQRRRAEPGRMLERLDNEIAEMEQRIKARSRLDAEHEQLLFALRKMEEYATINYLICATLK